MTRVYTSETKEITLHIVLEKEILKTLEGHSDGIWIDVDNGTYKLLQRGEKLKLRIRVNGVDDG